MTVRTEINREDPEQGERPRVWRDEKVSYSPTPNRGPETRPGRRNGDGTAPNRGHACQEPAEDRAAKETNPKERTRG